MSDGVEMSRARLGVRSPLYFANANGKLLTGGIKAAKCNAAPEKDSKHIFPAL